MKRYGQRCPVARALDVVGERWALLVVRELMVGPRRYRDLQQGLPGIGTNVLATRLRDLHDAGLVTRRHLPPPTAVTVYELTEAGRALGPTLAALRSWGAQHAPPGQPDDAMRPAWVLVGAAARPTSVTPGKVCELRVDTESFRLTAEAGHLSLRGGPSDQPAVVVTLDSATLYALVTGRTTAEAIRRRCVIDGDDGFAGEILNALHATSVAPSGASRPATVS